DGATDAIYRLGADDAGRFVRVRIVVETADGDDTASSAAVGPVRRSAAAVERLMIGAAARPDDLDVPWVTLSRWTVVAGGVLHVRGRLGALPADAALELRLVPTVPAGPEVAVALSADAGGVVRGRVVPAVNAVAWLVVDRDEVAAVRLGVVGVRPRIVARISARPDGKDGSGRPLVRDLRLGPGSRIAPDFAGLRLSWEGILPGERVGTAVCRASERVVSGAGGVLDGGCRTRGAWAAARWRLVYDPGTDDPGAAPFLAGTSAWSRPVRRSSRPAAIPALPRACATLRAWISASSRASSRPPCPAAARRSRTSWAPAATTSPSASRPSSSRAGA
ncbi:MAG: hypothetical protein ACO3KD_09070, partial [Gaiellales bacterium]